MHIPGTKSATYHCNKDTIYLYLALSPVSIVLAKALLQLVVIEGAAVAIDSLLDVYLSAKVALRTLMLVWDNGRRYKRARRNFGNHVAVGWFARGSWYAVAQHSSSRGQSTPRCATEQRMTSRRNRKMMKCKKANLE